MSSEQLVITRCREGLWLVWVLSPLLSMISIGLVFVYPPLESVAVWGAGHQSDTHLPIQQGGGRLWHLPLHTLKCDHNVHNTLCNYCLIVRELCMVHGEEFFFSVKGESNV